MFHNGSVVVDILCQCCLTYALHPHNGNNREVLAVGQS